MKKFVLGILTSLWLWFWIIFAQNILPDSAEIEVKSPIYENEAANLKFTMMKNDTKMTNYNWVITYKIIDQDWRELTTTECTLPDNWFYQFEDSDLWEKEFQKWLEIKKAWEYFIEVSDMRDDWKILGSQPITVIKDDLTPENHHIDIISPNSEEILMDEKVDIIAIAPGLQNSKAQIYLDDTPTETNVDNGWMINQRLNNISVWRHTVYILITNIRWEIIWESDRISFIIDKYNNNWVKVTIDPEVWLVAGDKTTIRVFTDEMVESVKINITDNSDNLILTNYMTKEWIWEFSSNIFMEKWWEFRINVETSASNNSSTHTYEDVERFYVLDAPQIWKIQTETDDINQSAKVSREILNWDPVYSYNIKYWAWDWVDFYWEEETNEQEASDLSKTINKLPYDTTIYLNITPIRKNSLNLSTHWTASKTVKFVIQKPDTCWNWVIDEWENCNTCAIDLWDSCGTVQENLCWNWIIDEWENCNTCARDLGNACPITKEPRCTVQNIETRTTKIWNSYYLIRDKVENVTKYIVYSSPTPDWYNKTKVYETSDTSYEYPFDYNAKEEQFMYFWIVWICDDWEELELTWATKIQVWPAENFFLLVCVTLLIYSWIKLFRQTEE